ncbi:unnamed protein product [Darwinula stevensoni]|uniref:Uncharacterized protein n=1 Tax=Darwinula stevensoni TaxID=69355 RepID=A0A7R8XMR0_9CRUS|nr:unnamed protein product [Darwinula stevensoni]CAG0895866.1 unnamed protein product [Darwinula stevensoni]
MRIMLCNPIFLGIGWRRMERLLLLVVMVALVQGDGCDQKCGRYLGTKGYRYCCMNFMRKRSPLSAVPDSVHQPVTVVKTRMGPFNAFRNLQSLLHPIGYRRIRGGFCGGECNVYYGMPSYRLCCMNFMRRRKRILPSSI